MGALPRPDVPPGPGRTLVDALHALHHEAGWPSLRVMAKEIGCSHTTVSAAFSEPRIPRWGLLELIVETLGGDTTGFHGLWLAASGAEQSPPSDPDPEPAPTSAGAPRQLPASVPGFTGRDEEMDALDRLLEQEGSRVAVVVGTAGVGKTALALQWAHRVAPQFPDGQLYVDLRGYDADTPLDATAALESLLRGLGVEGTAIPRELAERAAAYRSRLATKRVLVLLDNAHRVEQVRDLLPGNPECAVVVTSRSSMPAVVVRHGATRVNVDLLPVTAAIALLRSLVGERVDDEPAAALRLADQCARLPLALRIAAELAASRPSARLADLVEELEDEPGRLELLQIADDEYTAVRSVFSWSWRHLDPAAAEGFRLLGLHAGRDIGLGALGALWGEPPRAVRARLDHLERASLVGEVTPGRFGMHDLLRGYAVEEAATLTPEERGPALARLEAHYLAWTVAAMTAAYSVRWRAHIGDISGVDGGPAPAFEDAAAARQWLAREWPNLVASAHAAGAERQPYLHDLAGTLGDYLEERAHYDEALALHEHARRAARQIGDRRSEAQAVDEVAVIQRDMGHYAEAAELHDAALAAFVELEDEAGRARSLHRIGVLNWRRGRYDVASSNLAEAVERYAATGDLAGQGVALYSLGIAARRLGSYPDAEAHHRQAIEILHRISDRRGEAAANINLGVVCFYLGRYDEAVACNEAALAIYRDLDHPISIAIAWDNLGSVAGRQGRDKEALRLHTDALEVFTRLAYPAGQGDSRRGLGVALAHLGREDEAVAELERAIEIGRELGEAHVETAALCDLGAVHLAAGRLDDADTAYRRAQELATVTGDRYELARARQGIGRVLDARGDAAGAEPWLTGARADFTALGVVDPSETSDGSTLRG